MPLRKTRGPLTVMSPPLIHTETCWISRVFAGSSWRWPAFPFFHYLFSSRSAQAGPRSPYHGFTFHSVNKASGDWQAGAITATTRWHKRRPSYSNLDFQLSNSAGDQWVTESWWGRASAPVQGRWVWTGSINDASWETNVIGCVGGQDASGFCCVVHIFGGGFKKKEKSPGSSWVLIFSVCYYTLTLNIVEIVNMMI